MIFMRIHNGILMFWIKATDTVERMIVATACLLSLLLCMSSSAQSAPEITSLNGTKIFWIDGDLIYPENSTQYFLLPIPGGNSFEYVSGFKYTLDLPDGLELLEGAEYAIVSGGAFPRTGYIYPEKIEKYPGTGKCRYVLNYGAVGSNGVGFWISNYGSYTHRMALCGSNEWKTITFEFSMNRSQLSKSGGRLMLWILRWADNIEGAGYFIRHCRGYVDVDDIVVSEKAAGRKVLECNFENGFTDPFSSGSKINGVSVEQENKNSFIRMDVNDKTGDSQQSIVAPLNGIKPNTVYRVSCRIRGKVSKMPEGYLLAPVFIRHNGKKMKADTNLECQYEYVLKGTTVNSKKEMLKLRFVPDSMPRIPIASDVVLWSSAEDTMDMQSQEVKNILLDITRNSGIKTHLVELILFPWMSPYNGNVGSMFLDDGLSSAIHSRGMKSVPYVHGGIYDQEKNILSWPVTDDFLTRHPEASAVNSFNKKIDRGNIYIWHRLCPEYLAEKGEYWKVYLEFLKRSANENRWDGIMWDFEMADILMTQKSQKIRCFCPRCIDAFRNYSGIKDFSTPSLENIPNPFDFSKLPQPGRDILKNYPLSWLKFRGDQHARIWKTIKDAVMEVNKEAKFYLYTGSYRPYPENNGPWHHCEYYGVYLPAAGRYINTFMDIHAAFRGVYGQVEIQMVKQALESSGRNVNVLNTVWGCPGSDGGKNTPCVMAKNDAIQSVAYTGANGFQIYNWSSSFDSQTWSEIRKGVAVLADYEEYFRAGVRLDTLVSFVSTKVDYAVWLRGENVAVFVFNNSARSLKSFKIAMNSHIIKARFTARNHLTGESYPDPSVIETDIPAFGMLIIDLMPK